MAYKYAKGKVYRGDIYNEDDAQGNTFLDWNEDAVGIVAGGTTVFVVSGSTAKVGIGTDSPDYTLDVAGNAGFDEYIYHNGDADTFIRFEADEINIKAGGAAMILAQEGGGGAQADKVTINDDGGDVDFQVKGDNEANLIRTDAANDRVGIGTDAPDYTLDVAGNAGFDEYIYHNDDADTFIRFQDDNITIKAGSINFIDLTEDASQDKLVCNEGRSDVDFIVRSPSENLALYLNAGNEVFHINHGESNFKTKIHSTNGEAITVNNDGVILNEDGHAANDLRVESDSNTHMLFVDAGNETVGVGTDSAASTFDVDGSVSTKISSITGTSNTIGAVYTVLMGSDNNVCAAQLPAASSCIGRIYVFKRLSSAACKVQPNGSDNIDGSNEDLEFDNQYDTYTIQSTGTEWWTIAETIND